MGRYRALFLVSLGAALVLGVAARMPHRTRASAPAPPEAPAIDLALEIRDGVVVPDIATVPKGQRVRLAVANRGSRAASLTLAGYEDHLRTGPIAPGAAWTGEFLADRPGEDFAWLVDGRPGGKLVVTGSHLIEGHQ